MRVMRRVSVQELYDEYPLREVFASEVIDSPLRDSEHALYNLPVDLVLEIWMEENPYKPDNVVTIDGKRYKLVPE